jgi:hypothetical protein
MFNFTIMFGGLFLRTDFSVIHNGRSAGRRGGLHTLNLSYCTGFTNVDALAADPALNTLNLWGCTALTTVDALAGAAALHTLDLYDCIGLTSVDALGATPAMQTLILTNCYGLTNSVDYQLNNSI